MRRVYRLNVPPGAIGAGLLIVYALFWLAVPYAIKSPYLGEPSELPSNVTPVQDVLPVDYNLAIAERRLRELFLPIVFLGTVFLYLGLLRIRFTISNVQRERLFPYVVTTIPEALNRQTLARHLWKVFLGVFLLSIMLITAVLAFHGYATNSGSKIGDWLINYQGGFVRRGLVGEIFFRLSSWTSIPPTDYVIALQIVCYITYFLFAGLLLAKQQRPLGYLLLVVSPFIFLFQVHDVQGGFRKEIFYFALLAFFAWASSGMGRGKFENLATMILASYPLVILSHEMLAVFLPYVVAVYVSRTQLSRRSLAKLIGCLALSAMAFVSTIIHHGDSAQVAAICNSLADHAPANCEKRGSIGALRRETDYALKYVGEVVSSASYLEKYTVTILLSSIAFMPIFGKLRTLAGNKRLMFLVIASVLASLPLFFVAIDWGRLIYIHLVSLFLLTLIVDSDARSSSKTIKKVAGRTLFFVGRTDTKGTMIVVPLLSILAVLVLVLGYASLWRIDHCCGGDLTHNNFFRVWTEFPERLFRYQYQAGMG